METVPDSKIKVAIKEWASWDGRTSCHSWRTTIKQQDNIEENQNNVNTEEESE